MIILINISLLFAMPSPFIYQNNDDIEMHHLARRFQLFPSWVDKRNPGLCDYRLQLRPLPFTSALCTYG
jgi:hypothetical protein